MFTRCAYLSPNDVAYFPEIVVHFARPVVQNKNATKALFNFISFRPNKSNLHAVLAPFCC